MRVCPPVCALQLQHLNRNFVVVPAFELCTLLIAFCGCTRSQNIFGGLYHNTSMCLISNRAPKTTEIPERKSCRPPPCSHDRHIHAANALRYLPLSEHSYTMCSLTPCHHTQNADRYASSNGVPPSLSTGLRSTGGS